MANGFADGVTEIWSVDEAGALSDERLATGSRGVAAVALNSNETLLATAGYDGMLWLWRL